MLLVGIIFNAEFLSEGLILENRLPDFVIVISLFLRMIWTAGVGQQYN
jgi:hypothetical protein